MNAAFFSQRNDERCNLRCSISRADRDTTYTSLTQPGKYGINLLLTLRFFSICHFSTHGEKDPSSRNVKLFPPVSQHQSKPSLTGPDQLE